MTSNVQKTSSLKIIQPHSIDLSIPVDLHMLTRILAYFQKRTVKRLGGIKLISPSHARSILKLCYPIHFQAKLINAWHQDLNLFHALCLLLAADLLEDSGPTIIPSPYLSQWLSASQKQRKNQLHRTVEDGRLYLVLKRLTPTSCPIEPQHTRKLIFPTFPKHSLSNPTQASPFEIWGHNGPSCYGLEDWQWFDLYQIGHFDCGNQKFHIDQDSINHAVKAGFSQNHISWLLQAVNGKQLSPSDENQLSKWVNHSKKYRLRHAVVLSVAYPHDLKPIFKNKKLRQAVVQQLSSRHIIVRDDALPHLQKELGEYDCVMQQNSELVNYSDSSAAWDWLGARLLAGLRQFLPNTPTPSGTYINQLAGQLSLQAHADLEATATTIINDLRQVIQGKDQFFPAEKAPPAEWEQLIEKAVERETMIQLTYQSLGDTTSRNRTVWPHRLWRTAGLIYFSGWCELAGTDLTFRLDRAREVIAV